MRRVAEKGEPTARAEAGAWLEQHATPEPDTSALTMSFAPCDAGVEHPTPPADVDALLRAAGHDHYLQSPSGRWIAVHAKGIRFANDKGKRKTASLKSVRSGPTIALLEDDTVLLGGWGEVAQVSLASGKSTKLLERPIGEVAAMTGTADGRHIVAALQGENYTTSQLRVYDLGGEPQFDIPIHVFRFVAQVIPLWDQLVAVRGSPGVVVVDVKQRKVVATTGESVKEAHVGEKRLTLSTYRQTMESSARREAAMPLAKSRRTWTPRVAPTYASSRSGGSAHVPVSSATRLSGPSRTLVPTVTYRRSSVRTSSNRS